MKRQTPFPSLSLLARFLKSSLSLVACPTRTFATSCLLFFGAIFLQPNVNYAFSVHVDKQGTYVSAVRSLSISGGFFNELKADKGLKKPDGTYEWDERGRALGTRIPVILIHQYNRCKTDPTPGDWDRLVTSFYKVSPDLKGKFKIYRMAWHSNDVSVFDLGGQLRDFIDKLDDDDDAGFRGKPIILIGHSTGGLIARSYMQEHWAQSSHPYGGTSGPGGDRTLRLITLATPHHGSPLANKPYRDDYINDWDAHNTGNWSTTANLFETKGCSESVLQLKGQLPYDKPTRSDLHYDDSDGLFGYSSAPAGDYSKDKNDWLQRLNCVSPFNVGNRHCYPPDQSGTDYSAKIVAYGGYYRDVTTSSSAITLGHCSRLYTEFSDSWGLCIVSTLLYAVFDMSSDGAVPLGSALFEGKPSGAVQKIRKWDYNHAEMVLGKTGNSTDQLFTDVWDDVYWAPMPALPVAKLTMSYGGKTGGETSSLVITISKGATATVAFSSSGSTVASGSIAAYEWRIDAITRSTFASFPYALGPGQYTVKLTVTDNLGKTDLAVGQITIQEESSPSVLPSVTTNFASQVTTTSAILNGQLTTNASSATVWFQWGTTANYGQSRSVGSLLSNISTPIARELTELLPNTIYHFRIVAQNAAGVSYGQDRSFTTSAALDLTSPQVTITSPTSNPTYPTIFTAVALAGNASDDRGVTTVTWVNDRGGSGTASGSTNWSISSIPLALGQNVITVIAWDAAGHSGSDVITVTSTPPDSVSPDTQILSGPSGTWPSSSFTFVWSGSDNVTATGNLQYTTHLEGYDWSSTPYSTATSRSFSGIPNGTYTFWVRALDEAGNIDYTADTRTFSVDEPDLIAPTIISLFLSGGGANNDLFRTGQEYPIFFEVSDNIRPATADLYHSLTGGAPWSQIAAGISVQAGWNAFDWAIQAGSMTTNGAVRLVVRDEAGNSTEQIFSPFTILNGTPPTAQIIAPNGGEDWPLASTQTITWQASSPNSLDGFKIYLIQDGIVYFLNSVPATARSYQWTLPPTPATDKALIRIVAVDTLGIESEDFSDGFFRMSNPDDPPLAPWHVPQLVTTLPPPPHPSADQSIWDPAIAADHFGNLHLAAVYKESDKRDGVNFYTQQQIVYRGRIAGVWGAQTQVTNYPVDVDSDSSDGFGPLHSIDPVRVAVDQSGHPHIIWVRERLVQSPSFDDDLFYAYFDGSNWVGPINLSASVTSGDGSSTRFPAIAIDSIGRVHVVWTEKLSSGWTTYHAIKTGGSWSQPTPITLPFYTISEMVADGSGGVHLITPSANEVHHSKFDGSQWTTQSIVEDWPDINDSAQLAIAPDGTLHAVWHRQTVLGGVPENYLDYSAFRAGAWTSPSTLTLGSYYSLGLAIGVNALGGATVAWVDKSAVPPAGIFFIYASEPSVTGWSPISRISDRTTLVGSGTPISMAYDGSQTHVGWRGAGGAIWNWADYSTLFPVTPAQLNFDPVQVGQSQDKDFLVQNLTDVPVTGTVQATQPFITPYGAEFTVAAGESQNITIRFTPSALGNTSKPVAFSTSVGNIARTVFGEGIPDSTVPVAGIVTPSNEFGGFVDSPFNLTTSFTDNQSAVTGCEYTVNGGTTWLFATPSGLAPNFTCTKTGITGSDGQVLTLNMRATSGGGIGTGVAVVRTVDSAAPTTTNNAPVGWVATDQTVTLTPSDGTGSGIADTQYCTATANTCTPSTSGTVVAVNCAAGAVCQTYVRYRSTDHVGNVEVIKSALVQIDKTVPDTVIDSGPPTYTTQTGATFTFHSTESGSTFQCQLDGGGYSSCSSGKSYTDLLEGIHTFNVRATDAVGNTDPSPGTYAWTVDTTPPDTVIDKGPANPTNLTSATFAFSSTAAGATFQCSLDGATFTACVSPKTYTRLGAGNHNFQVRAKDAAGNTNPSPPSFDWLIDRTLPNTTITSQPPTVTNSTSASFEFTSTEAGSTFQCSLDGSGFTSCPNPQVYNGLGSQSHTFQVRAMDAAGNTDSTPAKFIWKIDAIPPETTIIKKPSNPTTSTSATFKFTSTERNSTFQCSVDGGAFAPCTTPVTLNGLGPGNHNFQVTATDGAGNVDPSPAIFNWTIQ